MTHYRKTMAQVLAEVSQVEANLEERLLDENDAALKKKAEKSGMPLGILKQVFKRGVAHGRVVIDQEQTHSNGDSQE